MKNLILLLIVSLLWVNQLFAQLGFNADGSVSNPSAMLDVKSTSKGFLLPRMTQAQRNGIINPAAGLQVYQTDGIPGIYLFDGVSTWYVYKGPSFFSPFAINGNDIYAGNTGNFGINTSTPGYKLTLKSSVPEYGMVHTDGIVSMGTFLGSSIGLFGTITNHPLQFFTNNGSPQMTILTNGKVGIMTTTPSSDLTVQQSSQAYPINNAGVRLERQTTTDHWDFGTDLGGDLDFTFNGVTKMYIRDTDGVHITTSDFRLKKDIQPIGEVLPLVMKLSAKTYHYRDNLSDAPLAYGFIAQEVEKLFPDFVSTKGVDGMKSLSYQNLGVVAIKAMQEQQVGLDDLLKEIETLENKK